MKKNKDPYPITDVYHVTDTLVDGATVVVTDLCDNLSNNIDTDTENILSCLLYTSPSPRDLAVSRMPSSA